MLSLGAAVLTGGCGGRGSGRVLGGGGTILNLILGFGFSASSEPVTFLKSDVSPFVAAPLATTDQ